MYTFKKKIKHFFFKFFLQVFACVGSITALVSFVSPIYNLIYAATYNWHKGFVYCVSCTILAFMFGLTAYVNIFMRQFKQQKNMSEDLSDSAADAIKPPSYKKHFESGDEGL